MELDSTAAMVVCALGALMGYQYGEHLKRAAQRAVAYCRPGRRP
jgi:hypothetical protein